MSENIFANKLMDTGSEAESMAVSATILMIAIDYSISGSWQYAPVYTTLGLLALTCKLALSWLLRFIKSRPQRAYKTEQSRQLSSR